MTKQKTDVLLRVSRILGIIATSGVIIGIIWAKMVLPEIDCRIDIRMEKMRHSSQYNSFILQELTTDDQLDRATKRFNAWKTGAGELK